MPRTKDLKGKKVVCEICHEEKSVVNIARHKKRCKGPRLSQNSSATKSKSKAAARLTSQASKSKISVPKSSSNRKDKLTHARLEFEAMCAVQERVWAILDGTSPHFPPCPPVPLDTLDPSAWIYPAMVYPVLFTSVMHMLPTPPTDATLMHAWVSEVAKECHASKCFITIQLPHSRKRQAEWTKAMADVSQRLNGIEVNYDRLEQARKDAFMAIGVYTVYRPLVEAWEAQCAQLRAEQHVVDDYDKYEKSLSRWKDYAQCRDLDAFQSVWTRLHIGDKTKATAQEIKPEVIYVDDSDETSSDDERQR